MKAIVGLVCLNVEDYNIFWIIFLFHIYTLVHCCIVLVKALACIWVYVSCYTSVFFDDVVAMFISFVSLHDVIVMLF